MRRRLEVSATRPSSGVAAEKMAWDSAAARSTAVKAPVQCQRKAPKPLKNRKWEFGS